MRNNNPHVSRNFFSFLENKNIARHEFCVWNNNLLVVPKYRSLRFNEFLERKKSILCLPFLNCPNNGIEKKDGENNRPVDHFSDHEHHNTCGYQYVNERALELTKEKNKSTVYLCFW